MIQGSFEGLALYALGDDDGDENAAVVTPIEELVPWLLEALEATEKHLQDLGFDPAKLSALKGFERAQTFKDAVEALNTSDEARRRFGILAREVFSRFKAMGTEPAVYAFAQRHDNIEAIYKKLSEHRDTSDVTALLKELYRIVNEAIRTAQPGEDHAEGLTVDLSRIDFEKLREEFEKKVRRKHTSLRDLRDTVEKQLSRLLELNPLRMDYYKKYQEIIADYNREKDRATVEATFAALVALAESLDAEARRAVEEGLSEGELALFDMLFKQDIGKAEWERLKQASRELLAALQEQLGEMQGWTQKAETQAQVQVFILDNLYKALPRPPFTDEETNTIAQRVYEHVWQQSASGHGLPAA